MNRTGLRATLLPAAVAATTLPTLLAFNVSPSPTFLNQVLAFVTWGALVVVLARQPAPCRVRDAARAAWPVLAALVIVAAAAAWSWGPGALPASLALSAIGTIGAAIVVVIAGAAARGDDERIATFAAVCHGFVVAGVLNLAIGMLQVFAPSWTDGDWVAHTNIDGRAVGNLRQPNHLSSVLLWAAIAAVALTRLRRLPFAAAAALYVLMIFGVVLTASRTGLVSVGLLALWGLLDRRPGAAVRALLLASPVVYALAWKVVAWWAAAMDHTFGGAARLAETDISGSRFGVWANTMALIKSAPWTGVGFGEFNFAWTLTPFPGRPTAFFDHTHNLPLQLAVELGLPLAVLVTALVVYGLVAMAVNAARSADDAEATCLRAALLMAVMIGLHSLLEYPLWYAYFLLPTAWVFGYGLGPAAVQRAGLPARQAARGAPLLAAGGAAMALLALLATWDYRTVADIFSADESSRPLAQRIERGQRSVLFAHHADYAAATTDIDPKLAEHAFDRATHYLLDTRLMIAWAEALAARGRLDEARHVADRLREFHNPLSKEFLGACDAAASAPQAEPPFQCAPATRVPDWREFLAR